MSPSFSEYFLMQHSTLGLSSISPALLLVRSFTCLRKVLGSQDLCAMGVSLLLGPLSVYGLLWPFQLEYFLPTCICSEIPLCVWRANYFSVTYTNSVIFFLQVCHLIVDYRSVSSQLKKGIFFLFPFPFGSHWPVSLVKMVRFRFIESQCLKNWSE